MKVNNLNLNLTHSFILVYDFEIKQRLMIKILEFHGMEHVASQCVGDVFAILEKIFGSNNQTTVFDIK